MSDVDEARTRLLAAYDEAVRKDARLARLRTRAEEGKATYADADQFAAITGRLIGILLVAELLLLAPEGPVPEEAAAELIPPGLIRNYKAVTSLTDTVQKGLNAKVGLGLKPVTPKLDQSRVNNLVKYVAKQEDFREQREVLPQLTENLSQSQVDDAARANAEFQYGAGRRARVVRSGGGQCCEWCMGLVGTYEYPDVPKEVWQRHANCSCVVEYFPGDGRKQNAHTKQWSPESREVQNSIDQNREYSDPEFVSEQLRRRPRQISKEGKQIVDKNTYKRLTRDFLRHGGIIIRGDDAANHLGKRASASYLPGFNVAFIKDDATVSDVAEEMFHALQDRQDRFGSVLTKKVFLRREIEAQEYLINSARRLKIPAEETEVTMINLNGYLEDLKKLLLEEGREHGLRV